MNLYNFSSKKSLLAAFALACASISQAQTSEPIISNYSKAMIGQPPASLGLDTFYQKHTDAYGIPVVASINVSDEALLIARDIMNYMLLKRPDVRDELVRKKCPVINYW
jgi:spermidine/putrescine-binding protein